MSAPQSPEWERLSSSQSSIHPALHPSVTKVPVTPGEALGGPSGYVAGDAVTQEPEPLSVEDRKRLSPQRSNDSYFARKHGADNQSTSPTEVAAGARSGEELLRRLSLHAQSEKGPDMVALDPRAAHPALNLSGGIISAAICCPYDLGYADGGEWVCKWCVQLCISLTNLYRR
jgi:trehalose 6-phosphate synthase/phosphatase